MTWEKKGDPWRILVTGSRSWADRKVVYNALHIQIMERCEMGTDSSGDPVDYDADNITIVHGACPTGADSIANDYGITNMMVTVEPHPAKWDLYGKSAGPIRNEEMVKLGADVCLAFVGIKSKGTIDCIFRARKAKIWTIAYLENGTVMEYLPSGETIISNADDIKNYAPGGTT